MNGSRKVARMPPMRTGAALLAVAVLSLGAVACGSSSDSAGSESAVTNKEAGGVITVPDLIGMSNFAAEDRARSLGFSVESKFLSGDKSDYGEKGIVVDQNPPAGTDASPGQPILLIIK
jgi:beta-lactam-binding protein with PASTA domain